MKKDSDKIIKDPVHGYITINKDEIKIVDSIFFQRLRNIMQLSTTQMVYPGARHSRFEHSLGVYYLCKSIFKNILKTSSNFKTDINNPNELKTIEKTLRIAALLHDIGHYPFSHLGEIFDKKNELIDKLEQKYKFVSYIKNSKENYTKTTVPKELILKDLDERCKEHELSSCLIILSKYKTELEKLNIKPEEVCAFILGFSLEFLDKKIWQYDVASQILNSNVDADRLDYILRDKQMSGAAIIGIDSDTMIKSYTSCGKKLALSMKSFSIINNFLESREAVFMWVCQHHKVVFSNAVVKKMINELETDVRKFLFTSESIEKNLVDDFSVICEIRKYLENKPEKSQILKEYYYMYKSRKFLKSCWKHILDFRQTIDNKTIKDSQIRDDISTSAIYYKCEFENYLKNLLGLKDYELIVDYADIRPFIPSGTNDIYLDCNDNPKRLSELNLHIKRDFATSIPYVYVHEKKLNDCIKLLNKFSIDKLKKEKKITVKPN